MELRGRRPVTGTLSARGLGRTFTEEDVMNWMIPVAVLLIVLWVAARLLGWVIGAAFHLIWVIALIMIAIWLFQKVRRRV